MNQPDATVPAGDRERCRRAAMHTIVSLATALTQNSDAIDDSIDRIQRSAPVLLLEHPFEADVTTLRAPDFGRQTRLDPGRVPAADYDPARHPGQSRNDMAPDKSGTPEHENRSGRAIDIHGTPPS
jgi:hypothetical protein